MQIQTNDRFIPNDELLAAYAEAVELDYPEDRLNALKTLGSRVFSHWASMAKNDLVRDQIAEAIDGNRWSKVMELACDKRAINLHLLFDISVSIGDAYYDIAVGQKKEELVAAS